MHRNVNVNHNQYGRQLDILTECRIRYSEDTDSIRIFFNDSEINPIYIPKTSAAYKALKKHFVDNEEKEDIN
jgi:hypothetical protein